MKTTIMSRGLAGLLLAFGWILSSLAQAQEEPANAIESLSVVRQAGAVAVKVSLKQPLAAAPLTFSVATPPRIAMDFPGTANALGRNAQDVGEGDLKSMNIVQAGNRTRLVLNLTRMATVDTRVNGKEVVVTLARSTAAGAQAVERFAESGSEDVQRAIRDISFRRGQNGEGRVIVDLSDRDTGIDLRQQGQGLVVSFDKVSLPDHLYRKLDVTDFATPVTSVNTARHGDTVRITITPNGLWEHNAYQSDNQFVVELKRVVEDPNKLVQGSRGGYKGEKLSLNFQNVDVRAVLQVIADFTDLNIITSDTVGGTLTLRLKDVPWDQALDIILQAKGLDMRKNGNVIWIAPRDELAAKEKLELEALQQVRDLEPLRTESFQINYHKAKSLFDFLKDKEQTVLSKRGSVIVDERSNKLFVSDVPSRLVDIRRLIAEIDVPNRQVLIEARIVEAEDNFARNLGARLGLHSPTGHSITSNLKQTMGGSLVDTGYHTGQVADTPDFIQDSLSVNLAASKIAGRQPGQFSFVLFNSSMTQFLNLELSALEADGRGKIISSPRVVTANQIEALIEQGVEIPYQQATSSGATSISFRKANLSLKVKPQITPDGRVNLTVDVNKDSPNTRIATGAGVAIDTKHVKTEVLVDNGGTVVIGGIYTQTENLTVSKVPFLGDLPYLGLFFKNTERVNNKTELLVFLTPKIYDEALSIR